MKKPTGLLALALFAGLVGNVCAADESAAVGEKVSQLESLWQAGSPSAQREYFMRAGEIAAELFREERTAARSAGVVLLRNLLAKQSNAPEVGATDLIARTKVARFVLDNPVRDDPQSRYAQLDVLKTLLISVRRETIHDYRPQPVYVNLPEASDALANQKNNLANSRQAQLQSMDRELSQPIMLLVSGEATASEKAELQRTLRQGTLNAGR